MNRLSMGKGGVAALRLGLAITVVLVVVLSAAFLVAPARAAPASAARPASGGTEQWAFGGVDSSTYSCSNTQCFGANYSFNGTFSLSWQYYIEWVVIYTQTNVSATQTMIEGQAALNATVKYSLSECVTNGTSGAPCTSESASITLSGRETALGFTNVTNTGTVNMTAGAPLGPTPALAIMNAQSSESFNFSGGYTFSAPVGSGGTVESGTVNFDVGANEASTVSFSTPLGIVPLNPQQNDAWSASAPFTATGSWRSGYSISASGGSGYPAGESESNWTSGTVAPSGVLFVNGTDLGPVTLYDNYTNPPTSVTAQEIYLDFGNGTFSAADGYVMIPTGVYAGIFAGLSGESLSQGPPRSVAQVVQPKSGVTTTLTTGESAYYEKGTGFVGASATGNATSPLSTPGAASPSVNLKAGPEPVSVAQGQYQAITSSSGSSSSSSSFPWGYLIVAVVVVVVVLAAVVMLARRSRRRPPAAMAPGPVTPTGAAPGGPAGPSGPSNLAPAAAPVAPVCPTCGQPSTYVAQYGRYYCYTDKRYL